MWQAWGGEEEEHFEFITTTDVARFTSVFSFIPLKFQQQQ
jgi:hypothetical protein